ncbi:MAG: RNA 2',3'-cyclic phosphodiesterase [Candidatus Diapherotrites archaeon CG08_land_8_20_14_0_20_30_16]|nr:MAG: RNA 2',3'-cyclic phosphodiesterase [Candidatus Diapherotrites archaeon CG08_land_8_20_14_0_20_30_16]
MGNLFLGIKVPLKISKEIYAKLLPLFNKCKALKIESPQNYHLTLKFYGNISKDKIDFESIKKCQEIKQFDLELNGLGQFNNRILFVKASHILVFNKFEELLKPDKFATHITVARNSSSNLNLKLIINDIKDLKAVFTVNKLYLLENVKIGAKKSYVSIQDFPLGK